MSFAAASRREAPCRRQARAETRDVSRRLAGYEEYPRLARLRGWQGLATPRLEVDRRGRLAGASLRTSIGHAVLDEAAPAMVNNVGALPPPAPLRGRAFAVVVRVTFRLEP